MIDPAIHVDGQHPPRGALPVLPRPADPAAALARPATAGVSRLVWAEMGPRQRSVAEGVLAGETNAQISVRLDMSVHTVREHLKRMASRLGARGRGGLIAGLVAARGLAEAERLGANPQADPAVDGSADSAGSV